MAVKQTNNSEHNINTQQYQYDAITNTDGFFLCCETIASIANTAYIQKIHSTKYKSFTLKSKLDTYSK